MNDLVAVRNEVHLMNDGPGRGEAVSVMTDDSHGKRKHSIEWIKW